MIQFRQKKKLLQKKMRFKFLIELLIKKYHKKAAIQIRLLEIQCLIIHIIHNTYHKYCTVTVEVKNDYF